jgi:hypothetical protein
MNIFAKLFGKKAAPSEASGNSQAVLVYLDGQRLPNEVYAEHDLATLEDQLIEVIETRTLGEFDGNEIRERESILYMYGPNAEALFAGIEPTLRKYPLCSNARVVIRQGNPGAPQRELRLQTS